MEVQLYTVTEKFSSFFPKSSSACIVFPTYCCLSISYWSLSRFLQVIGWIIVVPFTGSHLAEMIFYTVLIEVAQLDFFGGDTPQV